MDLKSITQEVCEIAQKAGEYIRVERARFSDNDIQSKGLNQLVSYVDIEAENMIVSALKKLPVSASFITEEATIESSQSELNWIVDPLDGTTNFMHGLSIYSVSIALANLDEVLLGVVYEVGKDECFYAWKDGGAWLNGNSISVSKTTDLSKSLLATGFPYYDFGEMESYLNTLSAFMESTHGLRRMGSAAVDLAYTACGRFEGFFEYGLNAWDIAAGVCLIKEAGGRVSDFGKGKNYLFGKEIIAGNSPIHQEMQQVIYEQFNS